MRVIIDTNVLVSAILKNRIPEKIILFLISNKNVFWIVSKEIMAEYIDVLKRKKFQLPEDILGKWIEVLDQNTETINVTSKIDFRRDKKDEKFLECAVSADVDFLVTGDSDFEQAQKIGNTKIVSVSWFGKFLKD